MYQRPHHHPAREEELTGLDGLLDEKARASGAAELRASWAAFSSRGEEDLSLDEEEWIHTRVGIDCQGRVQEARQCHQ